jgi:uncharacterized protein
MSLETVKAFFRNLFGVGGRLLLQVILYWVLFIPFTALWFASSEEWGHNESFLAIREIARLIVTTASVFMVAKIVDELEPESFGLKRDRQAFVDFSVGILIMLIVVGASFLVYLGLGLIQVKGFAWQTQSAGSVLLYTFGTFLLFVFIGWSEELLSRGFHLQTIAGGFNKSWAVFLSSLIFAWLHRNNPDISILDLAIIFFAGIVLAYAYLRTHRLWLSIGLHTGWNFCVVVLFFGTPIGRLRIFQLIDIVESAGSVQQRVFIYLMQFLELILCMVLIRLYAKMRKDSETL